MLKVKTIPLALMASLMLSSVALADDVNLLVESYGSLSNKGNTEYYVPVKKAKELPQWQPLSNQEPPLSLQKAIAIALRETKSSYPKQVRLRLYSLEMARGNRPGVSNLKDHKLGSKDQDFWFYVIRFSDTDASYTPAVLVLMDGSIAKTREVKNKPTKQSR